MSEDVRYDRWLQILRHPCWSTLEQVVSIPTVAVIGNQSVGKSSVLSEIAGARFPVQDGLNTKFITKWISRPSESYKHSVNLLPAGNRPERDRDLLRRRSQYSSNKLLDLTTIVNKIGTDLGAHLGAIIVNDVLEVEVEAPNALHMILVDLPGYLDTLTMPEQTLNDVSNVQRMIEGYVDNPQCLLLLVLDGCKDIAGNSILKFFQGNEAVKKRTIGIVTKPDLIGDGNTKKNIIQLVNNENSVYNLPLGWYLLRNRGPAELDLDTEGRDALEREALAKYSSVSDAHKGVDALRRAITNHAKRFLLAQIEPSRAELKRRLHEIETEIATLPPRINTLEEARSTAGSLATEILEKWETIDWTYKPREKTLAPSQDHWLGNISDLRKTVYDACSDLRSSLEGDKTAFVECGSPSPIETRARELLERFPCKYGQQPIEAAQILWHEQLQAHLPAIHKLIARITDSVEAAVNACINAVVAEHTREKFRDAFMDQVSSYLKSRVRRLVPDLPIDKTTDPKWTEIRPLARDAGLDTSRAHLDDSIAQILARFSNVTLDSSKTLPILNSLPGGSLNLTSVQNSLRNEIIRKDQFVENILAIFKKQRQLVSTDLAKEFFYPTVRWKIYELVSVDVPIAFKSDRNSATLLKIFQSVPIKSKERVTSLDNVRTACTDAIRLMEELE